VSSLARRGRAHLATAERDFEVSLEWPTGRVIALARSSSLSEISSFEQSMVSKKIRTRRLNVVADNPIRLSDAQHSD
jgi:hypothetical protein